MLISISQSGEWSILRLQFTGMIQSMTGYGRREVPFGELNVTAEVRSLNGKLADVRIKTPLQLGEREIQLRKMVLDRAVRGKIDVTLDVKGSGMAEAGLPDPEVIKTFYTSLKAIGDDLGITDDNLFSTVLRLPNAFQTSEMEIDEGLWQALEKAMNGALDNLDEFRKKEGASILADLSERVQTIETLLGEVEPFEAEREENLKDRLRQKIQELEREAIDQNRFEQEIIYYLDKLDIHEEKVRLAQHCKYFLEILHSDAEAKGKKLNFVSQEIGREINTLGAKAQWSPIQRIVVQMKDNLENIKEQLANAL